MTKEPLIVRGGTMVARSLEAALMESAKAGRYQLSVQVIPAGDLGAQQEVWQILVHKQACWSTPSLVEAAGFRLVHSPDDDMGEHHYDLLHPASPGEVELATVVRDYQGVFYGPGPPRSVNCDWTAEDLRRLQQPDQTES